MGEKNILQMGYLGGKAQLEGLIANGEAEEIRTFISRQLDESFDQHLAG